MNFLLICGVMQVEVFIMFRCGDFTPFAQIGMESNRRLRNIICFGMLMSVVGSEDIARIDPNSVARITHDTFLSDGRVRSQIAIADFWPKGIVLPEYSEPVSLDVPVLIISGTHDPVTPPRHAKMAARNLKRSLHLEVPGIYDVSGPAIEQIQRDFLTKGTVERLDTSGLKEIHMSPFKLPDDINNLDNE